jgi:hypothetical protein
VLLNDGLQKTEVLRMGGGSNWLKFVSSGELLYSDVEPETRVQV